jgi:hypothetical protein
LDITLSGRSNEYFCISANDLGIYVNKTNLKKIIKDWWKDIVSICKEESYTVEEISNFIYDRIDKFSLIKSKKLDLFSREMKKLKKKYIQGYWIKLFREILKEEIDT